MSTFRTVLRAVASSDRLIAAAAVIALLEGLLRFGLAVVLEPSFGDL